MMVQADRPDHAAEIRRRLCDPRDVCERLGLIDGAKPQPRGLFVRCPKHTENTPSCSVTVGGDRTLRVRCFGACGLAGDVFDLIAARMKVDRRRKDHFKEVLAYAAELAGVDLGGDVQRASAPLPPLAPAAERQGPPSLDGPTFGNVAAALLELAPLAGSVAVGLVSRGILFDAQADGWGELPTDEMANDFDASPKAQALAALRAGFESASLRWLLWGDGFARPDHRLAIPWRRPDGAIWGLQRRFAPVYGDETPPSNVPKYIWPSAQTYAPTHRFAYGVHRADELAAADEIWIVEGAADVLALRALNRNAETPRPMAALGIAGVDGWKDVRASVLPFCKGRTVHLSLDADAAGDRTVGAGDIEKDVRAAGARSVDRPRPKGGAKDWAELTASMFWKDETSDDRHQRRARERTAQGRSR